MKNTVLLGLAALALAACGSGKSDRQGTGSGNVTGGGDADGLVLRTSPSLSATSEPPPPAPYPPPRPPVVAPAPPPPLAPLADNPTNAPPGPVTVGGPPETCEVYEYAIPIQNEPWADGSHRPYNSVIPWRHNPPASGPNYEMWADYRRYAEPLARGHWVHNLRHGAIVLLYRPDAPAAVVDALAAAYPLIPKPPAVRGAKPDCPPMGIMTPDPELQDTFAVLGYGWMMTSNCAPKVADVVDFANRHIFTGMEQECYPGAFPVRLPCYRFEDSPAGEPRTYEVPEGTPVTYVHYPPTSGPFYDKTIKYGRYDAVVPAPYWTGIIAKGGVVVLYRPDAPPALIYDLKMQFDALSSHWKCKTPMVAMVQDPTLDHYFAYVGVNQYMTGQCTMDWKMDGFVSSRRGWGIDPFVSCDDGNWVPPEAPPTP